MVVLKPTFRAVTDCPLWVIAVFQNEVICWLPAKLQASAQPLMAAVPVLVRVRSAVNPLFQVLGTHRTRQEPPPPPPPLWVVAVTVADVGDVLPAASRARTLKRY